MPPLRLAILDDIADNPDSSTAEVRRRLSKPRATVDRQLQALHILQVLEVDEIQRDWAGKVATEWRYRLTAGIDPSTLKSVPDLLVGTPSPTEERVCLPTDISGTDWPEVAS
jgi:hypothetical protein